MLVLPGLVANLLRKNFLRCFCSYESLTLLFPQRNSDPYHTCYVLAGLSSTQHNSHFSLDTNADIAALNDDLSSPFRWSVDGDHPQLKTENTARTEVEEEKEIYAEVDKVESLHPVFVIPAGAAESTRRYFEGKGGFV